VFARLRYSVTNPGQVTGYAVAMPGDTAKNGQPVWYGGGKLAADLSWPRLSRRWASPIRPDSPLTGEEAGALWEYAARTAIDATERTGSTPPPARRPLPTRRMPPSTRCMWLPLRWAAVRCGRLLMRTAGRPDRRTAGFQRPRQQETKSATLPG
jgi:hypothetical protein